MSPAATSGEPRGRKRSRSPEAPQTTRSPANTPPRKKPTAKAIKAAENANKPAENASAEKRKSRSRSRTPPRKRPNAGAAISAAQREKARQERLDRERKQAEQAAADAAARGVHDAVRQHYNSVEQKGKDWRKTDSKIKGLRSYNNWVKSTIIQKFSPSEGDMRNGTILVLDIGCGKGGDINKWAAAPQRVELYVGLDPANISIDQAIQRYRDAQRENQRRRQGRPLFESRFQTKDCFGESIESVPIVREVGFNPNVGPGAPPQRWSEGNFDVVSMMFCMHYAFETEQKARQMLKNVAGALKKGGRFLGVIPNSDVIVDNIKKYYKENAKEGENPAAYDSEDDWDPEKSADVPEPAPAEANGDKEKDGGEAAETPRWGNSIYRVEFKKSPPKDGIFRPPYGWKYIYFLEEAVDVVPEFVVPWEGFRALAEDYNLELRYRRPFNEIWDENKNDPELRRLAERMRVTSRDGQFQVSDEEMEASSFYHAFCFYKV